MANNIIQTTKIPHHKAPCLMLPAQEQGKDKTTCHFFNLEEKSFCEFPNMPKMYSEGCCIGSSHGWLVFLDEKATPFLSNPFMRAHIQLPSIATLLGILNIDKDSEGDYVVQHTYRDNSGSCYFPVIVTKQFRESFINKVILSSDPCRGTNDYKVVMICDQASKLAYCKIGDTSWTNIDGNHAPYSDIICHENQLYALGNDGYVEAWDFLDSPIKRSEIEPTFERKTEKIEKFSSDLYTSKFYLVELCGDFLLVVRYIGEFVNQAGEPIHEVDLLTVEDTHPLVCPYRTLNFHVYKLDLNQKNWVEVDSLDNHALFLGGNQSISISARDFPKLEQNSIYFIDDYWERMNEDYLYGGHDMGVFSLKDQSIKPFCQFHSEKIEPPPSWIVPHPVEP